MEERQRPRNQGQLHWGHEAWARQVSSTAMFCCEMTLSCCRLKSIGFNPEFILDVGANIGDWSRLIKEVYPASKVFMIEGSETCSADLETTGNLYTISLVGKQNSMAEYFENSKGTGNSIYRERSRYFSSTKSHTKPIRTLDTLMAGHPAVQMLKLDIQGAELDALMGAERVLESVEVILLEISLINYNEGAPLALDTFSYLNERGFDLFDLIDFTSFPTLGESFLGQVDFIVVRRNSSLFTRKTEVIKAT